MSILDWIVLSSTLAFIVIYGIWKTRQQQDIKSYLLGNREAKWFTVALSIMATQASAITFLSAPGQAFVDGMRFVQFYFGLPLAMVVLSITVVPIYHKMNVFTAYEYLEKRFDLPTRTFTAILFLTQRGLAAGFTIFAPSLILSSLLGWDINLTNIGIGVIVTAYTVIGGTKAVNQTQKLQMAVIFIGMLLAGILVVQMMPNEISFNNALHIAGASGKLNAIDFKFDPTSKYNVWSGLIGGFFLAMSYFGTDQSQVQRYLSGSSVAQSRLALLFNGMIKIPMQFLILFIGAMVYVFYFFNPAPVLFNTVALDQVKNKVENYSSLEANYQDKLKERSTIAFEYATALDGNNEEQIATTKSSLINATTEVEKAKEIIIDQVNLKAPEIDTNDTNYIFLGFVINYLPQGLIGLLIAVILSASMSSTSSEINALASTSIVDIYKRIIKKDGSDKHYLYASKLVSIGWGLYAILFASFANKLGSLIEAVNILGSLVYGVILGIFMIAFYLKSINARPTFYAAIISEGIIIYLFSFTEVPFLWYNVIGCLSVILFGLLFSKILPKQTEV
ncbi:sodium:solute symporter [Flammeovirga kamogawensis]|uniref:Sodium:solute symporter n=1 Tax=Flammeovirga kamogawensis TaxID=373891 RepID=A0ABX8GYA7_9BACT|nr:sodium:solute symporter [Flammeovirga kamogawensis]MBB6460548.1 Na+/proline symporter [Flammeovirga kamogawensis]QWG07910.1 sodium:solute symporter [Flammeovirga kamogawensis]TRX69716.1 sodium:solute symporter [Flammeovirga kamogawensis]